MNSPLRICHISDCLPRIHKSWGGAEQACLRIIEASTRAGLDVSVITTRSDMDTAFCTDKGHKTVIVPAGARWFSVPTLESFINPSVVRILSLKHFGIDPVSFVRIWGLLKVIRPDVVHIHRTVTLTLSAVKAARLLGIPVVATVYDYFNFCPKETLVDDGGKLCTKKSGRKCVDCMGLKGSARLLKRPFENVRKKLFDYLLKNVIFHVLSGSSADILKTYGIGEQRIRRILQIFPLGDLACSKGFKKGLLLYIGWIQERKGIHIVLEAMPEILRHVPFAHVVAIGAINYDPYFDRIKNLIDTHGLAQKVSLFGKREYSEVAVWMREANVVVIPEQWENMSPVVLVEAMCYGRPVVASRLGGIPEFLEDEETGFLADPSSSRDFAAKITRILNDDSLALRFGERACARITGLINEGELMKNYIAMYEDVLAGEHA